MFVEQNTHVKLENTKLRGELAKAKTFMQQATVENDGLRDAIVKYNIPPSKISSLFFCVCEDKLKQELNCKLSSPLSTTIFIVSNSRNQL